MRILYAAAACTAAALLGGCAYQAPVRIQPNLNVYSSYGDKLPGKFLIYVEDNSFLQTVHSTGVACAMHSYPLDLRFPFRESAIGTLRELVEEVEVVEAPLPSAEVAARHARGMVIIKSDGLTAHFLVVPGFWQASVDSNVSMSATISVDGQNGRLFGTEAEGQGNAQSPAGSFCGGAANALAEATQKAMKQMLGQLGERFSNSPRLREASLSK